MHNSLIILISHQDEPEMMAMHGMWRLANPHAEIVVAYGGSKEKLDMPESLNVVFVNDPRLRTRDHPREKQSYQKLMREAAQRAQNSFWTRVLLAEYDVVPVTLGTCEFLEARRLQESADVLGVGVRRLDGTGHPHFLELQNSYEFSSWVSHSVRLDKNCILMMIGCLSWWTREAFEATAAYEEKIPLYLEIAMATIPHQLGFRVRNLPELEEYIRVRGDFSGELEALRSKRVKLAHPCKRHWSEVARQSSGIAADPPP